MANLALANKSYLANPELQKHSRGLGAEYLVAADLCLSGHNAFLSAAGMAFDVVVDAPSGLLRVQVKSSQLRTERSGPRLGDPIVRSGYFFENTSRREGGLQSYEGEADLFAFVAVDLRRVVYRKVPGSPYSYRLQPEDFAPEKCAASLVAVLG